MEPSLLGAATETVSYTLSKMIADRSESIALDAVADMIRIVQDDCGFERVIVVVLDRQDQPSALLAQPRQRQDLPASWLPTLRTALKPQRSEEPDESGLPRSIAFSAPEAGWLAVAPAQLPGERERILLCGWLPGVVPVSDRARLRMAQFAPIVAKGIRGDRLHQQRRASFHALLEHLRESITIMGPDHTLIFESPAARRMLGFAQGALDAFTSDQLAAMIHPVDQPIVADLVARLIAYPDHPQTAEYRAQHADGSWRWLSAYATNLIADPAIGGFVYSTVDITERKSYEARLEFEAAHDFLTGIANRATLERTLEQHLRTGDPVSLLYIDLDGFHGINGAYGHAAGDAVLQVIARRLADRQQPGEIASRFGGDEFLIMIPGADLGTVDERARGYLSCFHDECVVGGRTIPVRASIGVARSPNDGQSLGTLYRAADRALYRIKGEGTERIAIFNEQFDGGGAITDRLAQEFLAAAETGALRLYFQPIRDLETDDVLSYEGLIRWDHPEMGLLTPKEILPIVDEFGYGDLLATVCVREAIGAIQRLELPVAINLSPRQLHYPELAIQITAAIRESGIDPAQFILEITEGAPIISQEEGLLVLRELHDLGVRVAIDDFGTGYSDLAALRSYPIDTLKIDRSFIAAFDGQEEDYALITAILAIAKSLGVEVIAEGLETERQVEKVRMLGCRKGQGYLLGIPQPIEALGEPCGDRASP